MIEKKKICDSKTIAITMMVLTHLYAKVIKKDIKDIIKVIK